MGEMFGRMNIVSTTTRLFAMATVLLTKHYSGDQIEKNEIGRACSMYGERCTQGFGAETCGKETTWKTQA